MTTLVMVDSHLIDGKRTQTIRALSTRIVDGQLAKSSGAFTAYGAP